MTINEEKEREIIEEVINQQSEYTIEELTSYLIKSLQQAIESGKKISFICAVNAILRVHIDVIVRNQKKDFVIITLREQFNDVISHLKEQGFPDLTKEEAESLISTISTSQALEQQE
jgi:hypothetical protein